MGLPVIAAAISRRIKIKGQPRNDLKIKINLPDIDEKEEFTIKPEINYKKERDYFRSSLNILQRDGFTFSRGVDCTVRGNIPINSGLSSSSALTVAWIKFLAAISDQSIDLDSKRNAEFAFEAEVAEFSEPGGRMDHYTSVFGGNIFIDFRPDIKITILSANIPQLVLGDSRESKDTRGTLDRVKTQIKSIKEKLIQKGIFNPLKQLTTQDAKDLQNEFDEAKYNLLRGTIRNYEITLQAKKILQEMRINHSRIGSLISEQNKILRDILGITTKKIDRMVEASLRAGALGAKITGSGGGGCMFAYCIKNHNKVLKAIEKEGGKGYIIEVDEGIKLNNI